jgi:hypothetical protein
MRRLIVEVSDEKVSFFAASSIEFRYEQPRENKAAQGVHGIASGTFAFSDRSMAESRDAQLRD